MAIALVLGIAGCQVPPDGSAGASGGPDVGVSWVDGARRAVVELAQRGDEDRLELRYRLYNQGTKDAYAVVIETRTALGEAAPPQRLEPGPRAGETITRVHTLSLIEGMREICVEVRLQTLAAGDPRDQNTANNRACRLLDG